jgi:hypothetical protein
MLPSIFRFTYLPGDPWPLNTAVLVHDLLTGELAGVLERRGRRSFSVRGHEYLRFKTWEAAAWALRDYYIDHHTRYVLELQLSENEGRVAVVKRFHHPRGEHARFKSLVMSTERVLQRELLAYPSLGSQVA